MFAWMKVVSASGGGGFFELEVLTFQNNHGRLANGRCCNDGLDNSGWQQESGLACRNQCATQFRLCLKEYQRNVTLSSPCTYGQSSSPVLTGNSFTLVEPNQTIARLVIPFSFSWPVSRNRLFIHSFIQKYFSHGLFVRTCRWTTVSVCYLLYWHNKVVVVAVDIWWLVLIDFSFPCQAWEKKMKNSSDNWFLLPTLLHLIAHRLPGECQSRNTHRSFPPPHFWH